jgi:toxin ParE1/3/4
MAERKWRVRLGAAAELDFANIVKWTTENFGARQSRVYQKTLGVAPKTTIEIIRILHDRLDLQRHLPFTPDENAE